METMHKSSLYKAVMLALTTTALVACGSDDDNDKKSADTAKNPSSISKVAALTANTSCTNGGHLVHSGIDDNGNGVLDDNEIDDTVEVCDGQDGSDGKDAYTPLVSFAEVALPTDDSAKRDLQTTTSVTIDGVAQTVSYTRLMATGDKNNGETFGLSKDVSGAVIQFEDASDYLCNGTNDGVGSGLDYVSILQKHDKLWMVAQFECQVGSMYSAELEQTAEGVLSVKADSLKFVDQSNDFGGFVHCAGQTTPWQSHLGSEEYEPDANEFETALITGGQPLTGNKYTDETALYWSTTAERATGFNAAKEAGIQRMSPYFYGWTPEVTVEDAAGNTTYTKHYAMGRFSHELAYVMPDQRTVYMSDDGTNVGLFMFVADAAMDLSAGTLYAAKWIQTSDAKGGRAEIDWVNLGHTDNATVRNVINKDLNFSDVFDTESPSTDHTCPTAGFHYYKYANECLKVADVDGSGAVDAVDEVIASRLEARRYAAIKGATLEFRKEEGITFDADHSKLYVAMSSIEYGMESYAKRGDTSKTYYDDGGPDDIRLPYNACGAVYAMDVTPGMKDTSNTAINSRMVVSNMNAVITGTPDSSVTGNSCDVNGISNPDNVAYLQGSDTLVIGEDTGQHENNMVWAYNVVNGELTRIATTPLDAETTSPFWHDINGFGYMTLVSQHPLDGVDGVSEADKQSNVGVIGPMDLSALKK